MFNVNEQRHLLEHLAFLYDEPVAPILERLQQRLNHLLERYPHLKQQAQPLDHTDSVVITYADQVQSPHESPLASLKKLYSTHLSQAISSIHLLPFFPYSSDDGFSVIDYLEVNPNSGTWDDVKALAEVSDLMFDAVVNHISAQSSWFQAFLADQEPYKDYFICESPDTDLRNVVRPRTSALLSPFMTEAGERHVWTTFSSDQVDLNYANPEVLLEMTLVLLEYAARGARIIRLDAITYLWKEVGTSCVHHAKTHRVLEFWRSLLSSIAPQLIILTETNVPHAENIAYFGNGHNEAHMVYNFALPPLVLHTLLTGTAQDLQAWARELHTPSKDTTFFNFLASHDGIGLRPVEQLLSADAIGNIVKSVQDHGGLVSYKTNSDGSQSPYELNINYFDALSNPQGTEALEIQIDRFILAHAIMMSLPGVPALYMHSILGSRSYLEGVKEHGYNRAINREKLNLETLEQELQNPEHRRHRVLKRLSHLLALRKQESAFHPNASMDVLDLDPRVFAHQRHRQDDTAVLTALHNCSTETVPLLLPHGGKDLISQREVSKTPSLAPYQVMWLWQGDKT